MNVIKITFSFLIFGTLNGVLLVGPEAQAQNALSCPIVHIPNPPVYVVPTGYDSKTDQDAVEKGKEKKYANYVLGTRSFNRSGDAAGKTFVVPKRSLVVIHSRQTYETLMKKAERAPADYKDTWVPVQVISVPKENKKLQEASLTSTKEIAKPQFTEKLEYAQTGNFGFLKVADLERIENQKDYVFTVTKDSELFKEINKTLRANDVKALEPFTLKLKKTDQGYEVRQCCYDDGLCKNFPLFEIIALKNNQPVSLPPVETDCLSCENSYLKSMTPIEEKFVDPIRSILSHPSLGLPTDESEVKKIMSMSDLNFLDSRGMVQFPIKGEGYKKTGPFNSYHYGAESGDADVYMKPDVACGFLQFLKSWDQTCKGKDDCAIEFGDASHAKHKHKVPGGKNSPWPHATHTNGECIDINTDRMADKYLDDMMIMLKKLGQDVCLTMEKKIMSAGGCKYDDTGVHDTHMHICFPSNMTASKGSSVPNPKLKAACEKGVSP